MLSIYARSICFHRLVLNLSQVSRYLVLGTCSIYMRLVLSFEYILLITLGHMVNIIFPVNEDLISYMIFSKQFFIMNISLLY